MFSWKPSLMQTQTVSLPVSHEMDENWNFLSTAAFKHLYCC